MVLWLFRLCVSFLREKKGEKGKEDMAAREEEEARVCKSSWWGLKGREQVRWWLARDSDVRRGGPRLHAVLMEEDDEKGKDE
jgi:hypothetical protein